MESADSLDRYSEKPHCLEKRVRLWYRVLFWVEGRQNVPLLVGNLRGLPAPLARNQRLHLVSESSTSTPETGIESASSPLEQFEIIPLIPMKIGVRRQFFSSQF